MCADAQVRGHNPASLPDGLEARYRCVETA